MTIGITENGFLIETLDEIRTSLIARLQARWGNQVKFTDTNAAGHLVGVMAERYADLQQLLEAVYRSFSRETATGDGLRAIGMLTGTEPRGEFPSAAELWLTGTAGTLIPVGRQAESDDGVIFATDADATLAAATAWSASTGVVVGAVRTNGGNVYLCTASGVTAGSGGPLTEADSITDNTATWRYVGAGVAYAVATAAATEPGPLQALSGEITAIRTPVSGWESVRNILDADLGAFAESDESFRLRAQYELAGAGSHTVDAIRADLLRVPGVTSVRVLNNVTDETVDGMPPHTVEALVLGGADADIAALLFEVGIGLGYASFGNVSATVKNAMGSDVIVSFSRPEEVDIYVEVDLVYDANAYPADGDEATKVAIVTWGDAQDTGKNAVASAIGAQVFGIAGVLDVSAVRIGLASSPTTSTTIDISLRQLAKYDTSRIVVNATPGTP